MLIGRADGFRDEASCASVGGEGDFRIAGEARRRQGADRPRRKREHMAMRFPRTRSTGYLKRSPEGSALRRHAAPGRAQSDWSCLSACARKIVRNRLDENWNVLQVLYTVCSGVTFLRSWFMRDTILQHGN